MRPPAVEIRIIKPAPGMGWEYVARVNGETLGASDGDAPFDHPGRALQSAIEGISAALEARRAVSPAPTIEGAEK
jgi:hypothetical protein